MEINVKLRDIMVRFLKIEWGKSGLIKFRENWGIFEKSTNLGETDWNWGKVVEIELSGEVDLAALVITCILGPAVKFALLICFLICRLESPTMLTKGFRKEIRNVNSMFILKLQNKGTDIVFRLLPDVSDVTWYNTVAV